MRDTAQFDSSSTNEFVHYSDSVDSSLIDMENGLRRLKEDYEKDPTNSLLKDEITELEKSLEILKSMNEDITQRDKEIQKVIQNK